VRPTLDATSLGRERKEAVMQLALSHDERAILREILDESLSELRGEISATSRLNYRDELRVKKAVTEKVIAAIDRSFHEVERIGVT
jgi:hypothetical protein